MNDLMPVQDFAGELTSTNTSKTVFCSIPMDTPEQKKFAFNAMSNPDMKISEAVNLPLDITDIYCETAQVLDTKTGELKDMPRVVLIDKDGKSYQSVSFGIYTAISRLISVYGPPHWDPPVPLTIKRIGKPDRQTYTLSLR